MTFDLTKVAPLDNISEEGISPITPAIEARTLTVNASTPSIKIEDSPSVSPTQDNGNKTPPHMQPPPISPEGSEVTSAEEPSDIETTVPETIDEHQTSDSAPLDNSTPSDSTPLDDNTPSDSGPMDSVSSPLFLYTLTLDP